MDLRELTDKRVLVVGLGRSGLAAARLCLKRGARVTVTDSKKAEQLAPALGELQDRVALELGGHRVESFTSADLIVLSPGVPPLPELQAAAEAVEAGIPLTTLEEHPVLNLGIDGADQIDHDLNAIKGGGGALLREKVVASASRRFIVIADGRKLTGSLGEACSLPVEVHPFALGPVQRKLIDLGAEVSVRSGSGKLGPVVTDNGNLILDADFGAIPEPRRLERELKAIPGIIETGLFLGCVDIAFIGTKEGMKRLDKKNKREI